VSDQELNVGKLTQNLPVDWYYFVEPGCHVSIEKLNELIQVVCRSVLSMVGFGMTVGKRVYPDGTIGWRIGVQINGPVGPGGLLAPLLETAGYGLDPVEAARQVPVGLNKQRRDAKVLALFGVPYRLSLNSMDQYLEGLNN
jgi:hypothetical protein